MKQFSAAVQIIRYKNRKLYSRTYSTYVTLADIRDIIREGRAVQVTDFETSEDITSQTLAQVLTVVSNVPVLSLRDLITGAQTITTTGTI